MTPEFSRPQRIDRIGTAPTTVTISAEADERERLAARFGLIAVDTLSAEFALRRQGADVLADGRVIAEVAQPCIATGEPVAARIEEPVSLRFVPEADLDAAPADEVEIDAEAADTLFYTGGAIDLGEAAAETMALALDPYPRSPAAEAALREAGVKRDDEVATGAFAGLKDLLKGE
ncbi:YceD family protein [Sphingomonas sp. FW199]|uniref:YceD family protein n=1 Tax=Sphingomonas sp. FW199 TaxID=3400217 RepID=UPI003CF7E170